MKKLVLLSVVLFTSVSLLTACGEKGTGNATEDATECATPCATGNDCTTKNVDSTKVSTGVVSDSTKK